MKIIYSQVSYLLIELFKSSPWAGSTNKCSWLTLIGSLTVTTFKFFFESVATTVSLNFICSVLFVLSNFSVLFNVLLEDWGIGLSSGVSWTGFSSFNTSSGPKSINDIF